jgi:hypothetical protein
MLTGAEVRRGVHGAWLLLLGDRQGLSWIDRSPSGAWRSFLLAPLLYPLDLANFTIVAQLAHATAPFPQIIAVQIITYAISWSAIPLIMLSLAPAFNRERQMLGYIATLNWSSTITAVLFLGFSFLLWADILPGRFADLLFFVQLAVLLVYGWFIAKLALDFAAIPAALLSLAQLIFGFFLSQIAFSMIR